MKANTTSLEDKARKILNNNWIGNYTIPARGLYPHQWSWDSAFIMIGYNHYDLLKAKKELDNILSGQWKSGLLPHIVFDSDAKGYFPDPEYWGTRSHSPAGKITSGIIQPPVHAIAALRYYQHSKDENTIKEWFSKIFRFHRYLLEKRDPEHSGFATIYHPWESGFDNSPRWDEALKRITPEKMPDYKRIDIEHVKKAQERPTDEDYDKYIYLIEIMKKYDYDDEIVYQKIPFKMKDVVFNTILYVANKALFELSQIIGERTNKISNWLVLQENNFVKQFCPNPQEGLFYDYDLTVNDFVKRKTVAALLPIYAGFIDRTIIENTVKWVDHSHFCSSGTCKYPVIPSTSLGESYFAHVTYWRGPIWINTNWMIYQGLRKYNFERQAKRLRTAILNLVRENGFYEYFDPHNGTGHGAENFSWTASLIIDLIHKCDMMDLIIK